MSEKLSDRGVTAEIFRWKLGDCSWFGLSSKVDSVTVLCEDGPSYPSEQAPAVKLVKRFLFGREYVHAEPVEPPPPGRGSYMAGGSFVYTSDGRFHDAANNGGYPVSLHDRAEPSK